MNTFSTNLFALLFKFSRNLFLIFNCNLSYHLRCNYNFNYIHLICPNEAMSTKMASPWANAA